MARDSKKEASASTSTTVEPSGVSYVLTCDGRDLGEVRRIQRAASHLRPKSVETYIQGSWWTGLGEELRIESDPLKVMDVKTKWVVRMEGSEEVRYRPSIDPSLPKAKRPTVRVVVTLPR